jgi:hypothetical protein
MKIHTRFLLILVIIFLPFCKKGSANPNSQKLQYAVFPDITNGKKLKGLTVNLLTTRELGGRLGGFIDVVIDSQTTDSDGKIEYRNNAIDGFDCTAPGFLPFHHYAVGLIDYDGLAHTVRLVPEAYLPLHLIPTAVYQDGYKLSLQRFCGDSAKLVIIDVDPGIYNAIDTTIIISAGDDINNKLRWALSDNHFNIIAKDSIPEIIVARTDTGSLNIQF